MSGDSTDSTRRTVLRSIGAIGATGAVGGFSGSALATQGEGRSREWMVGCNGNWPLSAMEFWVNWDLPASGDVTDRHDEISSLKIECAPEDVDEMRSALGRLRDRWYVDYVEPNYTYRPVGRVDSAADQAGATVDDPLLEEQYAPQQVNAPEAWNVTLGNRDVTIGIVDTGVDYTHPDLADQFGDDPGRDFVADDDDPAPPDPGEKHGTHVAGIAAAGTNDAGGMAGISTSSLLSARVLGGNGGSMDAVAKGVRFCANRGADVINMSLSGPESETMKRAIDFAIEQGALPIAAAGNSAVPGIGFPASYEPVVAVSALDENETPTTFTQFGPGVDIAAPGRDVLSAVPENDHAQLSGTSMASPVVAGVAALGKALHPGYSPQELRRHLEATATDLGLCAKEQGVGRVDADRMVRTDPNDVNSPQSPPERRCGGPVPETPNAIIDPPSTVVPAGEPITFDASRSNTPNEEIVEYNWQAGLSGQTASGPVVEFTFSADERFELLELEVVDDAGRSGKRTVQLTVIDLGDGKDDRDARVRPL